MIAYGYYSDRVKPRQENVLRVGDRHFNYAYVERRLKSDFARGFIDTQNLNESISQSIARIQREELIRIIAHDLGITATDEEIDAEIASDLGLGDDIDHNVIASNLRQEVIRLKLPLEEYLEGIEASVLQDKIEASFSSSIPEQVEQVNLLLITAGSDANAVIAKRELDSGLPFADVAHTYSQDDNADKGGAFGWAPRELLDPELADIAFSISGRSDIIETEKDFYIIEVLGKEVREVSDQTKAAIENQGFRDLLEQAFNNTPFAFNLTQGQINRLAAEIGALSSG